MNMVRFKNAFKTKSTKTPLGHLKQSYFASLELSILGTLLNPHKKQNIMGKFQAVRLQLLELPHYYSTKLQSQAATTLRLLEPLGFISSSGVSVFPYPMDSSEMCLSDQASWIKERGSKKENLPSRMYNVGFMALWICDVKPKRT